MNYYVLVRSTDKVLPEERTDSTDTPERTSPVYRCAIDVDDSKRGTTRTTLVNDVFGLLTNRYVIHEKAVMHRVVQSATAMLSRALMLLGERKPKLRDLVRLGEDVHALQSEPLLFLELLRACEPSEDDTNTDCVRLKEAREILLKLVDRRVYRPLMIIPGDRAARRLPSAGQVGVGRSEFFLRTLAAIVESPLYSPFLLFVSACVEKYLQGAIGSDHDVCEYAKLVVEDNNLTDAAMTLVPSRVIISASPYKQLYKDPAVVVALPEWNGRIDELTTKGRHEAAIQKDDTLFDLVDASIHDADAKYAALWKLYVFVSDGLYYTGLLNKLNERARGEPDGESSVDEHADRLRQAQLFLLAALEAICEDWFRSCKSPGDLADSDRRTSLRKRLQSKLNREQFIAVLNLWKAKFEHAQQQDNDPLHGLSTVSISQYVHGDPLLNRSEKRCRDIRYKADTSALQAGCSFNGDSTSDTSELLAFLAANGISDFDGISHGEFQQLLHRYAAAKSIFADELRNGETHSSTLKLLWLTDLPMRHTKRDVSPAKKPKKPQLRWDLPETGEEIQRWLLNDVSRRLKNVRVRRQLEGEVGSIASFLEAIPVVDRRQVFEDLQVRLVHESRVLTNDIKDGQIMHLLREESGHLATSEDQSSQ